MRLLIRCIYRKAVEPSCDIVEMDDGTWRRFLDADKDERISIACQLLNKESMKDKIREVAWVPLSGEKLKDIV